MPGPFDAAFANISEKHRKEAAPHLHEASFGVAESLMEAGDRDPVLALILDGQVEIVRDNKVIDKAGPGEIVGEISFFTGKPRVASVFATEDTHVWLLGRDSYDLLRGSGNEVAFAIEREMLRQLGVRMTILDERLAALADETSPYLKPALGMFARLKSMFFGEADTAPEPRKINPEQILERSTLFAGENTLSLRVIGGSLSQETFSRGTFICTQGEPAEKLYILAGGTIDVIVTGLEDAGPQAAPTIHRLGILKPGAVFGTTSFEGARPRRASFIAREAVDVLSMTRENVESLVQTSGRHGSGLRVALIRALSSQQNAAGAAIASALNAEGALRASAIIELTGRFDASDAEL